MVVIMVNKILFGMWNTEQTILFLGRHEDPEKKIG